MPSEVLSSDESYLRLHAAGRSIGDAAYIEQGSGEPVLFNYLVDVPALPARGQGRG